MPLALDSLGERARVANLLYAQDVGLKPGDHPGERRQLGVIGLIVAETGGRPRPEQVSRFHVAIITSVPAPPVLSSCPRGAHTRHPWRTSATNRRP